MRSFRHAGQSGRRMLSVIRRRWKSVMVVPLNVPVCRSVTALPTGGSYF